MNGSLMQDITDLFEVFDYAIHVYDAEMSKNTPRDVTRLERYLSRELHKGSTEIKEKWTGKSFL
jgi:hypothetical protein